MKFKILYPKAVGDPLPLGRVRIHYSKAKELNLERLDFVRIITNNHGVVRQVLMGANIEKDAIVMDYETAFLLGLKDKKQYDEIDIKISKAKEWEKISFYWKHPDNGIRVSFKLGLLSLFLGLLGLVIGIIK